MRPSRKFVVCRVEVKLAGQKRPSLLARQAEPFGNARVTAPRAQIGWPCATPRRFVQTPKLVKVLFRPAADLLLVGFLQTAGGDGELAAKLVQKRPHESLAVVRGKGGDGRMELPAGIVGANVPPVRDSPRGAADILQVGLHDTPTAPQIFVDPILGQFHKCAQHHVVGGE